MLSKDGASTNEDSQAMEGLDLENSNYIGRVGTLGKPGHSI